MILVVGSTGMVGSEICRMLASKGIPFRAMVRETSDPAKVERLKGYKAQIVKGQGGMAGRHRGADRQG